MYALNLKQQVPFSLTASNTDLDAQPTAEQRAAIDKLIQAELPPEASTTLHPLVKEHPQRRTDAQLGAMSVALQNIADTGSARKPDEGIDSARYEEVAAPTTTTTNDPLAWRESIRAAYKLQAYLDGRAQNLDALSKYGKNAWLMSNFELENELRSLEKDLKEAQKRVQDIDELRRLRQEGCAGEMEALGETWRDSLGRAIEAEVETEKLRKRILEARRARAGG